MPAHAVSGTTPEWNQLFELAQGQAGYFTTREAAEHHIGTALLTHHARTGRIRHAGRGVFRFAQYPPSAREELVPLWLWSDRQGVFSHETALSLLGLSDLAPTHVDLTVPRAWNKRRLKVPEGLMLHFDDIDEADRTAWEAVPCTGLVRTLNDCSGAGVEEQFLAQAVREATRRGQLIASDRERLRPVLRRWLPRARRRGGAR
jgi:predicted transcriptional regulator of viral defense system